MKQTFLLACCAAAVAAAGCVAQAQDVTLVEDGVAKCRVESPAKPSATESFLAKEIAKYVNISTGAKIEAERRGGESCYPIELRTDAALKPESFVIETRADGMTISGGDDLGLLYGAYELLKRHFGMRWLIPGEEGEYCVLKGKTVRVPVGRNAQAPDAAVRRTIGHDYLTALWHARNNMQTRTGSYDADARRCKDPADYDALAVKGCLESWHMMSRMMIKHSCRPGQTEQQRADELFAEHPEWFPLIDGKRTNVWGVNKPNPCLSNPALLDFMAENLVKVIDKPHGADATIIICNNDNTIWCQCEKCRALDAPEAKGTRGELADRYWWVVNQLAERVWRKLPNAHISGSAYQNFWFAPRHVKPDPRLDPIMVSYNNQCWRHALNDPECPVNKVWRDVFGSFREIGARPYNRSECAAPDSTGAPGCEMLPSESVVAQNYIDYPELGCSGDQLCVQETTPATGWKFPVPYGGTNHWWHAMWQSVYVSGVVLWDRKADWKASLEEANALYYGAGWQGGMKEFRALLTKYFLEAPGCQGWGLGTTTGRCLDEMGSLEKLQDLLARSFAAAKASGDARAEMHVARDIEIFNATWVRTRKRYVENYREMTAYKVTGEIVVDGVLDEADWRSADVNTKFVPPPWRKDQKVQPSSLRIAYDRDHLYLAFEGLEPTPEKIVAGEKVDRNDDMAKGLGNCVEILYAFPDMGDACWHLAINSKGQIVDSYNKSMTNRDMSIRTRSKWAVKVLDDRWVLEIAIPCSEIGQNIFDGSTWKLNVSRDRVVEGQKGLETSAISANGRTHGVADNFVNVRFMASRQGIGSRDMSSWKNSGFEAQCEIARERHPEAFGCWKGAHYAKEWLAQSSTGGAELLKHEDGNGHFLRLTAGRVLQFYLAQGAGKARIRFRARGTGGVGLVLANSALVNGVPKDVEGTKGANPHFKLTADWQTFSCDRELRGVPGERIYVSLEPEKGSVIDLDDVQVYPVE